ncbi:MAG: hypothetical protein GY775_20980 [Candidatus Scalindua sp.]|nr:hypothetical protein [Candidatus Scalindua sp.]
MNDCLRVTASLRRLCVNLKSQVSYLNISEVDDLIPLPTTPGIYGIETTMPVSDLNAAIETILGKNKGYVTDKPLIVEQNNNDFYLCYLGTEKSIRARLGQHLFNKNKGKEKLGCDLTQEPFSNFSWRIWYYELPDITTRYAVESWWRYNIEWPPFCLRGS